MYRDDHEPTDSKKDFAKALVSRPPKIQAKAPDVCSICFKHWTRDDKHQACCLPCGHIFGASCIKKWLQIDTLTRHFLLNKLGLIAFHKLETARRNFSLKKWYDAKKRLAGVLGRKNEAMKCQTDLLERMKALEQQGGSLCRADALGTLVDEYLRRAKACEGRAKALRQRA
ncbi:zinc finger, RING/FYVE/PHD-type containing protein [Tanacetum coccineum]